MTLIHTDSKIIITTRREGAGTVPIKLEPLDRSEMKDVLKNRILYLIQEQGLEPKDQKILTQGEKYISTIVEQYSVLNEKTSDGAFGHP